MRWLLLLLFAIPALGKDPEPERIVPRRVQVSVGQDHVFVSVRARLSPADLGEPGWARWDRDRDGVVSAAERGPLLASLRAAETEFLSISVAAQVVPVSTLRAAFDADVPDPIPLDAELRFRAEGRMALKVDGPTAFTLYDRPHGPDGIVPIRMSLVRGLAFVGGTGTRGELRGPRRLEAVASQAAPAMWGAFAPE